MDEITLTLPRERAFHPVAHLVLGGLATRLGITFERLEDLQIALDALLEVGDEFPEVTIRFRVSAEELETAVGPFDGSLEEELENSERIGLARILGTVVDGYEVSDDHAGHWITVRKRIAGGA